MNLVDRSQTSSLNPLGVYDSSTTLWLQGKGKTSEANQKEDTQNAPLLFRKTEDFNKRLREQPEDTELWIKFIHYQVKNKLNIVHSVVHTECTILLLKNR